MYSNEFSCIRRDMVSGVEEVGDFLLNVMNSERVAQFNSDLQHRNFKVIGWLETHGAPAELIIVNYESAWRMEKELLAYDADLVIADEAHKIKEGRTKQSKALHHLGDKARYKLLLTGTLMIRSPLPTGGRR